MPVYNGEKTLESSISSILGQTFADFEFLIVDDGSTDGSLELIRKFQRQDRRIRLLSRENRGLIDSLNEGIEMSGGEYIARMDCDDISLPSRLEKQIEAMESESLDICGSHFLVIDDNGKTQSAVLVPIEKKMFPVWLSVGTPFAHGSVMIRKSFFSETGLRYSKDDSSANEDMALWMRFFEKKARFGNVDEVLFKYRWYPESFSHKKLRKMKSENIRLSKDFFFSHKELMEKTFGELLHCLSNLSAQEKAFLIKSAFSFFLFHCSSRYFQIAAKVEPQITLVHTLGQLNLISRFFWLGACTK